MLEHRDADAGAALGGSSIWPPVPTLGGLQLWSDVALRSGWRVQVSALAGRARLLDPDGVRRAVGSRESCVAEMRRLAPAWPEGARLVLLLHGLFRTRRMFRRLAGALAADGWTPCALSYASTRRPLVEHAAALASLLDSLPDGMEVAFVGHSLGGIVIRAALGDGERWRRLRIGPVALLAPPSQGAVMAQIAGKIPPVAWAAGPCLPDLRPGRAAARLACPSRCLVIAGCRGDGRGWNPLVPGDDDGIVGIAETSLAGADATVVRGMHSFIAGQPAAIAAVVGHLRGVAPPACGS